MTLESENSHSVAGSDYSALSFADSLSPTSREFLSVSPISANGERLSIDPLLMNVREPYVFRLADQWFIAIKQPDEEVDFYSVEP